jgi:hypothetical protein
LECVDPVGSSERKRSDRQTQTHENEMTTRWWGKEGAGLRDTQTELTKYARWALTE